MKREVLFLIDNMNYIDEKALALLSISGYLKGKLLEEMLDIIEVPHDYLSRYLKNMKQRDYTISMQTLSVTGHDIKEILDIKNSPQIGEIKLKLLSHVIAHPEENTRDTLINILKRLAYPASMVFKPFIKARVKVIEGLTEYFLKAFFCHCLRFRHFLAHGNGNVRIFFKLLK